MEVENRVDNCHLKHLDDSTVNTEALTRFSLIYRGKSEAIPSFYISEEIHGPTIDDLHILDRAIIS